MSLQSILDTATNPNVAVPVSTAGVLTTVLNLLPHVLTLGWLVYVVVLVGHKIWKWRQEWKAANAGTDIGADDDA